MSTPLDGEPPPSDREDVIGREARRWLEAHPQQGVVTCDTAGNIRSWNRWMELSSGRAASELVGRRLLDAFPDLVTRKLAHYFDEALQGDVRILSQRLHGCLFDMPTHAGGGRFTRMQQSAQIAPLRHQGQIVGTIATISDVTDRVAREAALQADRAEALAANRAKDEFLAVLSHELRTPLHAILGWTRVLRDERVAPDKLTHGLSAIERNAQLQRQLVEDLLDVSRIVSGNLRIELQRVDVRRAVEGAMETLRPAAEAKRLQVSVAIDPNLRPVMGDAARLQQIVWNLVGNAVKFTPDGGTISVVVESDGNRASLTVTDDGQGIAADFLPHVFERFRQSDSSSTRSQGGLGLGLSIVHRLVELHGGTLTASSPGVGCGASFHVTLPHAESTSRESSQSDPAALRVSVPSSTAPLAGVRILLVEDDDDGREILALALEQEGAEVIVAASAAAARAAIAVELPHILVSDIGMPGEDGYALLRSIRQTTSGARVPAIALTGYAGLEDQRRARDAGFDAHLTKPVDLDELVKQTKQLTARR